MQFNNLTRCLSGLGNRKLCNTYTRKRGCLSVYFLIWNYLKNVSYDVSIKNANKLQKNYFKYRKNDRMNDFNISVAAKHREDDNQEKKIYSRVKCDKYSSTHYTVKISAC